MDQKLRLDIRIIKFQDFIRRKPDRPFGYYGLGVQYMLADMPNLADKMFSQALKKSPAYVPAMIGKLEVFLRENKYIAAARYYDKNRSVFVRKKIYIKRINNIVSNIYLSRGFSDYLGKLRSFLAFDEKIGALQKLFGSSKENPVVNILLAMYYLKKGKNDDRACPVYNLCVNMKGITDRLRWDLAQALSTKQPAILRDVKIAGLFQSIPENAYKTDYVNFLLSSFMAQQDMEKVMNAFSELNKKQFIPSKKAMWEYLLFCKRNDIWNSTVALYCQKLIESGWINSILASTAIQLKNKGIVNANNGMFKILSLYSYYEA
ncbi:MAG TPA: hypothetical protein VIL05_15195 [Thermoclostridium sp.]